MNNVSFNPFPVITTERLVLRKLKKEDDEKMFLLRTNPTVAKYLERPITSTIDDVRGFIKKIINGINKNEWIMWVITSKDTGELIGTVCLWNFSEDKFKADLGYEMYPEFEGKGIMTEAVNAVINFGFNSIHLKVIDAEVDPQNIKSIKILDKFNFKLTVELGENKLEDGTILNTVIYSLPKPE